MIEDKVELDKLYALAIEDIEDLHAYVCRLRYLESKVQK